MRTRFLVAALYFFVAAAAFATGVALLAPIDAIRFLGVVALACAGTGFLVQLQVLRRIDPDAYILIASRLRAAFQPVRALAATVTGAATHSTSSSRSAR